MFEIPGLYGADRMVCPAVSRPGLVVVVLVAMAGCSIKAETPFSECLQDSDCTGGLFCVADLTAGKTYCSSACETDSDCPSFRTCRTGVDESLTGSSQVKLCIDRTRACQDGELCNGLDDNCDGTIDENCVAIEGCLDDPACGAFTCTAPPNFMTAICMPPNDPPGVPDYAACTSGDQCRNGLCETGICAPLCRPPIGADVACRTDFSCVRAIGLSAAPLHNTCQKNCVSNTDCTVAGQRCVWRDVYQGGDEHQFVCTKPGPGRTPLGGACTANTVAGDDECESGLCFEFRCTRPCGGPGSSCDDVGGNLACKTFQLFYGGREFMVDICADR